MIWRRVYVNCHIMCNVYAESRDAGLCLSLQMPAPIISLSLSFSAFPPQHKASCCSALVPESFLPSTFYKDRRLQTQFVTVLASTLQGSHEVWCHSAQHGSCNGLRMIKACAVAGVTCWNTSTIFFLLYHLIWSRSQCHFIVQIKTMVKAAQEHYKAEAGFTEWGHLTL